MWYPCCSQSRWATWGDLKKIIIIFLYFNFAQLIALREDFELCSEVGEIWPLLQALEKVFCWKSKSWVLNAIQIGQLAKSLTAVDKFYPDAAAQLLNHNKVEYISPPPPNIFPILFQIYFASSYKNIFRLLLQIYFASSTKYISPPPTRIYSPPPSKVEIWIFKHSRDGLKIRLGPEIFWH